jgi:hypothetical protein
MAEGVQPKLVWGKKETTSVDDEQQQTQPIVSFVEIMEEQEQEVRKS